MPEQQKQKHVITVELDEADYDLVQRAMESSIIPRNEWFRATLCAHIARIHRTLTRLGL